VKTINDGTARDYQIEIFHSRAVFFLLLLWMALRYIFAFCIPADQKWKLQRLQPRAKPMLTDSDMTMRQLIPEEP